MVNPELKKRFVDLIKYLRKMEFFQDYSNLSSEEILDRIFNGEIDYETRWFVEGRSEEERRKKREEGRTRQILKKSLKALEELEEYWIKANN